MASDALVNVVMLLLAYITFLFVFWGLLDWLSAGFLTKWMLTRLSRGKKWLVRVWLIDGDVRYYRGMFDGNMLRYKDKDKQWRRIRVRPEAIYRSYGVKCVEVDDEKNAVRHVEDVVDGVPIRGAFRAVSGHDAVTTDNLIVRALTLPKRMDKRDYIILFLVVVLLGLTAFAAYFGYQTYDVVSQSANIAAAGGPVI